MILKKILRVTNLGALSLVLNAADSKSVYGLIQDPQLTGELSQTAIHDPDTKEIILWEQPAWWTG